MDATVHKVNSVAVLTIRLLLKELTSRVAHVPLASMDVVLMVHQRHKVKTLKDAQLCRCHLKKLAA
jgi:hypothetical protein